MFIPQQFNEVARNHAKKAPKRESRIHCPHSLLFLGALLSRETGNITASTAHEHIITQAQSTNKIILAFKLIEVYADEARSVL